MLENINGEGKSRWKVIWHQKESSLRKRKKQFRSVLLMLFLKIIIKTIKISIHQGIGFN